MCLTDMFSISFLSTSIIGNFSSFKCLQHLSSHLPHHHHHQLKTIALIIIIYLNNEVFSFCIIIICNRDGNVKRKYLGEVLIEIQYKV